MLDMYDPFPLGEVESGYNTARVHVAPVWPPDRMNVGAIQVAGRVTAGTGAIVMALYKFTNRNDFPKDFSGEDGVAVGSLTFSRGIGQFSLISKSRPFDLPLSSSFITWILQREFIFDPESISIGVGWRVNSSNARLFGPSNIVGTNPRIGDQVGTFPDVPTIFGHRQGTLALPSSYVPWIRLLSYRALRGLG